VNSVKLKGNFLDQTKGLKKLILSNTVIIQLSSLFMFCFSLAQFMDILQARIKGLEGSRHFVIFTEPKLLLGSIQGY